MKFHSNAAGGCTCTPLPTHTPTHRRKAKIEKLRRRGKAPPKKGEGKRAGKKK